MSTIEIKARQRYQTFLDLLKYKLVVPKTILGLPHNFTKNLICPPIIMNMI